MYRHEREERREGGEMERREERGRGEGVCVSVAIWPRSAPRMSTAIERGTNTMAPRGWELLPSAVRGGLVAHRCRPGSYPATGAAPREPRLLTRVCFTTRGEPSFRARASMQSSLPLVCPCSPLIHIGANMSMYLSIEHAGFSLATGCVGTRATRSAALRACRT